MKYSVTKPKLYYHKQIQNYVKKTLQLPDNVGHSCFFLNTWVGRVRIMPADPAKFIQDLIYVMAEFVPGNFVL